MPSLKHLWPSLLSNCDPPCDPRLLQQLRRPPPWVQEPRSDGVCRSLPPRCQRPAQTAIIPGEALPDRFQCVDGPGAKRGVGRGLSLRLPGQAAHGCVCSEVTETPFLIGPPFLLFCTSEILPVSTQQVSHEMKPAHPTACTPHICPSHRLQDEHDSDVIVTSPTVPCVVRLHQPPKMVHGAAPPKMRSEREQWVYSPADFPADLTSVEAYLEAVVEGEGGRGELLLSLPGRLALVLPVEQYRPARKHSSHFFVFAAIPRSVCSQHSV